MNQTRSRRLAGNSSRLVRLGHLSLNYKKNPTMKKFRTRRRVISILLALLLIYSAGYVVCRLNKSIVHSAAAIGGKCTGHEVTAGDF